MGTKISFHREGFSFHPSEAFFPARRQEAKICLEFQLHQWKNIAEDLRISRSFGGLAKDYATYGLCRPMMWPFRDIKEIGAITSAFLRSNFAIAPPHGLARAAVQTSLPRLHPRNSRSDMLFTGQVLELDGRLRETRTTR